MRNRTRVGTFSKLSFILVLLALVLASGLAAPASAQGGATPAATASAANSLPGWLKVYFTNPQINQTGRSIDRFPIEDIRAAKRSIDVTSFDLNLPSFVSALVQANARGVKVRVVVDHKEGRQVLAASDNPDKVDFDALGALTRVKIPVVDGGRSVGLMHDKMIIIDSTILYMGSWNMSFTDTFRNDNNLLRITSQRLIANYQAKFEELFTAKRFGKKATVGAQTAKLTLDGVAVENYFSPVDKNMDKIVAEVKAAQKSVRFIAFTYTHPDLSTAMIERAKAGVKVEGIIEKRQSVSSKEGFRGAFLPLFCAKLPVKLDGNAGTMHHKVIIIDDAVVITGSFNFTAAADEENDDNLIIIRSAAVAAAYTAEFNRVYGIGEKGFAGPNLKCP